MTTEKYRKINTKQKSNRKSTGFVFFLQFRDIAVVSVRYFLILCVYVKKLQNNQQIKELQAAYENRKRFTISLNEKCAQL